MKIKSYRARAAALRAVGFKITYGTTRAKGTDPSRSKSAVTRAWKRAGKYLQSGRHRFIESNRRQKDAFASGKSKTPKGFFQPLPFGVSPSKVRFKIRGRELIQRITIGGTVREDRVIKLDVRRVAVYGQSYVKEMTKTFVSKNPEAQFRLMVNGWDGRNTYDPGDIGNYLVDVLLPSLRKQKLTAKQVDDIFHLKMISWDDGRDLPGPPGTRLDKAEDSDPF